MKELENKPSASFMQNSAMMAEQEEKRFAENLRNENSLNVDGQIDNSLGDAARIDLG